MPPAPPDVPRVLVVSSWYPSTLDPVAGRFVADQVAALRARGNVSPAVVSFDPADLIGSGPVRARIARAVHLHVGAAVRGSARLFEPVAAAPGAPVAVARLGVPSGRYREAGATHGRAARLPALEALADRWARGIEADVARPVLVHAHTVYPDGAAAARLALGLGCPLVLTEHASAVARLISAPEVRAAYLETVRVATRLIVVSRALAVELVDAMPEIEPKVEVIPNGVAMTDFRAAPIAGRRDAELLFVGYRKATKGISTLLRAVATVRGSHPGISLRLVGGSPTEAIEAGWRREAAGLGIDDIVAFDGPADRSGVADAMARASLFIHPSPRETFGVVAVEALASGLPVIAADSGGVTEILGDRPDELGAVVPPDRPDLLAAAIGAALDRRATFDPAVLRASVESRFAADAVASRLEGVYAEALAGAPATASEAAALPPAPTRPDRSTPLIVVALDPTRAGEVARVAAAAGRAAMPPTLVTTAGFALADGAFEDVVRLPDGVRVSGLADSAVLRSGGGGLGRWLQLLRHPVALARRRGWLGGVERAATTAGDRAIRDAIRSATASGSGDRQGPVELVCADGLDHLAAAAVIAEGLARPAPGGVRWLGDVLGAAEHVVPAGRSEPPGTD